MHKTRILIMTAVIVTFAAYVTAQEAANQPTPTNDLVNTTEPQETEFTPLARPAVDESAGSVSTNGQQLITIALDDVAMIDVVRMFSRIANANIIATPSNLTARVTANLDQVEWRPALSSILAQHNLALVEKPQGSGVYSILNQPPDAPEPMVVETLFLDYTTVDEVAPVVQNMLPPGASLTRFPSRNAMVIRSTEGNLSEIAFIVKKIDIESKQVVIETQFVELNDEAIKQLGVRWDSLASLGVNFQAGPFSMSRGLERVTGRTDTLTRNQNQNVSDVTDQRFNMAGDQFEVQSVTFVEDPNGNFIQTADIEPTRLINSENTATRTANSEISDALTRTVSEASAAILNVDGLSVVLSALKQTDGVSIVSNPKVIVANGSTNAFFRVGSREPIIRKTIKRGTADSPGDEITANLDTAINTDYIRNGYLETGIELKVVPTVKIDNLIEAQIEPSLRRKTGDKEVEGNTWPIISVKEIKTKFTLESGQTVAIGGLTDTRDSKKTSKVPLLGDIPILGKYLFSHEEDVKRQEETIIFVTLSIVNPRELNDDEGIPQKAELVHKTQIRDRMRRIEVEKEIEALRKQAQDLESKYRKQKREEISDGLLELDSTLP